MNEELEQEVLQAQLRKNSVKILHDSQKGGVKSIEVKAYGRMDGNCDEAGIQAVKMLGDAIQRLKDEGYSVEK